jgi:uncharacterized membrane protein YkvA (DUF1232 family)
MRGNSTSGARGLNPVALLNDIFTAWRLLWSARVPFGLKLLLPVLALVYWFSPIDLLPLNPIDDIALLILALKLFIQFAPGEAVDEVQGNGRRASYSDGDDAIDTTWRVIDDE